MSKNPKSVEEMTLESVRNEVAELLGWTFHMVPEDAWLRNGVEVYEHPVEISLDTVAALMPPLWKWEKFDGLYVAWIPGVHKSGPEVVVEDTGDEKADRFRLLLLILRKESNV